MIRLQNVTWQRRSIARTSGAQGGNGARPALSGLSLDLPHGAFRWLLGPSGSGKTSLLRLLHLEALPTSGMVEILGTPIDASTKRPALARLRQRIGMVHQDFRLMPTLSVMDNVALPLRLQKRPEAEIAEEVNSILNWVGLSARANALPTELSGGEQQRTAIARAVIHHPAVILADEPTNALEDAQANRLITMLRELSSMGAIVIVATHNDALVRRYDAPALHLERGMLVAETETMQHRDA